jgi:hypothetical protein
MDNSNNINKLLTLEQMTVIPQLKFTLLQVERVIFRLEEVIRIPNLKKTFMHIERSNIHKIPLIMFSGSKI